MSDDRPDLDDAQDSAQVLRFRRRAAEPPARASVPVDLEGTLADDLARYEQEDGEVDYRRRMLMNVIAVTVVAMLVGFGVWIADTIADMEKDQDCVMQGRANCAPIEVPVTHK